MGMYVRFQGWRPPRHPLLRLLLALVGLALLGFFAAFGLIIAAAVMAALGLRALLRQISASSQPASASGRPEAVRRDPPPQQVLEGEYRVIHRN